MNDDERTERRLRATLREHAEQVDPHLSGPDLRRLAEERESASGRVRRLAPAIAAAAAVVVIATVGAVIATHDSPRDPAPVPPGGRTATTSVPLAPSTTATPVGPTSPSLPTVARPSLSGTPGLSPRTVPATRPTAAPTATAGRGRPTSPPPPATTTP